MGNICISREDSPRQLAEQYEGYFSLWQEVDTKLRDENALHEECARVYHDECHRRGTPHLTKGDWQEMTGAFVSRISCNDQRTKERIHMAVDRSYPGPGIQPINEHVFWDFTRVALGVAERDLRDRISKLQERAPGAAPPRPPAAQVSQAPAARGQDGMPPWAGPSQPPDGMPPQQMQQPMPPHMEAQQAPWQAGQTLPPSQMGGPMQSEPDLMPSVPLQLTPSARRLQEEQRKQAQQQTEELQRKQELEDLQRVQHQQQQQEQRLQALFHQQQQQQQQQQQPPQPRSQQTHSMPNMQQAQPAPPGPGAQVQSMQQIHQQMMQQQAQQQQQPPRLVSFEDQQGYDASQGAASTTWQVSEEQVLRAQQKAQALASSTQLPPPPAAPATQPGLMQSAHLDQTLEVQQGTSDDMAFTLHQPGQPPLGAATAPAAAFPDGGGAISARAAVGMQPPSLGGANGRPHAGVVPQTGLPPDHVYNMKELILNGQLPVKVFNKSLQLERKLLALSMGSRQLSILREDGANEDSWGVDHLHSITKGIPRSILPNPPSPDSALAFRFRFSDDNAEDRFLCVVMETAEIALLAAEAFSQLCAVRVVLPDAA